MTDRVEGLEARNLTSVWVEHMLGTQHGPLVKLDAEGPGILLRGQLGPEAARRIARHLMEAAARAEYEADLFATMEANDWPKAHIGAILAMVRDGEENRLTKKERIGG